MKLHTRLDNTLAYQLFEFIKSHLIKGYSGKIIKLATQFSRKLKFIYSYLIKKWLVYDLNFLLTSSMRNFLILIRIFLFPSIFSILYSKDYLKNLPRLFLLNLTTPRFSLPTTLIYLTLFLTEI